MRIPSGKRKAEARARRMCWLYDHCQLARIFNLGEMGAFPLSRVTVVFGVSVVPADGRRSIQTKPRGGFLFRAIPAFTGKRFAEVDVAAHAGMGHFFLG
jgi:hypothetical protein